MTTQFFNEKGTNIYAKSCVSEDSINNTSFLCLKERKKRHKEKD